MNRNQRAFRVEEAMRSGPGVDDGMGKELTVFEKPTKVSVAGACPWEVAWGT